MRKALAMLATLGVMAAYALGVVSLSGIVNDWPRAAQLGFYVVAGIAWVFPLKPVMDWMKRAPAPAPDQD